MKTMALYLIGDLQGCNGALGRLLDVLDFSASRDTAYFLGDLVNRGPDSVGVLRRLMGLGDAARCLLGNHDLHLLAAAHGVRAPGRRDTLNGVLMAADRDAMLDWLRQQPLVRVVDGVAGQGVPVPVVAQDSSETMLLVHAGVQPSWTVAQTLALAEEVAVCLRGPDLLPFLQHMYGNAPAEWADSLQGFARLRVIVNTLTRLRYCTAQGAMEFDTSSGPPPPGYMPWFDVPGRQTAGAPVAFGHWSTLGWLTGRTDLWSLDSGCVWGGQLSALKLGASATEHELIQVACAGSPQGQISQAFAQGAGFSLA
jgi:bis(5'-nucleosyl)-tetraphosphatase (symmetrical)